MTDPAISENKLKTNESSSTRVQLLVEIHAASVHVPTIKILNLASKSLFSTLDMSKNIQRKIVRRI